MTGDLTFPTPRGLLLGATLTETVPSTEACVVVVHGYHGDRRSRGRFPRLAGALASRGVATLAFDCAGCGASPPAPLTLSGMADDARAALALVRGRGYARVALLGHSLGSRVVLEAADPEVATVVLTAALAGPILYEAAEVPEAELRAELAAAPPLERLRAPALLVLGDGDDEERRLLDLARAALPTLPAGSKVAVVPGAAHGFGTRYGEVIGHVVPWLIHATLDACSRRP